MLWLGKHITRAGDVLEPVEVEKIHRALQNPYGEVAVLQKRLQAIRMIDLNQYRKLKTALPYLVCAQFQPRVRKKENFVFTERFIVDIDHLSEFDRDREQLREQLKSDPRVELLFSSPGGDGLKLLFVLKERISDSGYYALFYKSFCLKFAETYHLAGAVDTKTNDVSRCCFVSYDPEAWYNPGAEKTDASAYMPDEGASDFDRFHFEIKEKEKNLTGEKKELGISRDEGAAPLTDDILNQIKQKVGMRVKKPVEKTYIQPEELDHIIPQVLEELTAIGVQMVKMVPINYGRQIKVAAGDYWAEVNVFYGQRGVKIVGTTKTGSNKKLCESVVLLLQNYFSNNL
ncbi:MAG: CRISPR-associated primase-polymerase type B [Chitinophagaceae bacterium]|nr:CRISPR-associated primase-polymerase type B [Chitinophagaceae bacterium]